MLNKLSIDAVNQSGFSENFCKPLYSTYCFSNIPATIEKLLTGDATNPLPPDTYGGQSKNPNHVILLFLDGFGWHFLEKYAHLYPFLQRFNEQGIASKITSQFPSTTAGHVTCIHTAEPINVSGIYEWFHYDPHVDGMICPLLYSFAGDNEQNTLLKTGVSPDLLYPTTTFYEQLAKKGIDSYVFQQDTIAFSTFSKTVCKGAHVTSFSTLEDALLKLLQKIEETKNKKSYFFVYWGEIDSAGHHYGPQSPEFKNAIDHSFTALENLFWSGYQKFAADSSLLITADHGQVATDISKALYVNKLIPDIIPLLKRNRKGELLVPAGSPRDLFLHVKADKLSQVKDVLTSIFKGKAEVHLTQDLVDQGLFGLGAPSARFNERVGNLVILPNAYESVFWYEENRFSVKFHGNHGGLTREEMETIFLYI